MVVCAGAEGGRGGGREVRYHLAPRIKYNRKQSLKHTNRERKGSSK